MPKEAQTVETPKEEKPPRPVQALCSGCNHPETFHRSGECKVMACVCAGWDGIPGKAKLKET